MFLGDRSPYPQPACGVKLLLDGKMLAGRELVRISTGSDIVESAEGLSEFVVLSSQVLSAVPTSAGENSDPANRGSEGSGAS